MDYFASEILPQPFLLHCQFVKFQMIGNSWLGCLHIRCAAVSTARHLSRYPAPLAVANTRQKYGGKSRHQSGWCLRLAVTLDTVAPPGARRWPHYTAPLPFFGGVAGLFFNTTDAWCFNGSTFMRFPPDNRALLARASTALSRQSSRGIQVCGHAIEPPVSGHG